MLKVVILGITLGLLFGVLGTLLSIEAHAITIGVFAGGAVGVVVGMLSSRHRQA